MRKHIPSLLFLFLSAQFLSAQTIVRDTIYANIGDEITLNGLTNVVTCGPLNSFNQPDGEWEGICFCIDATTTVTETRLYTHRTPSYACPPPPPGPGPQPPAGPQNPELVKETLVIVNPNCDHYTGIMFFETCSDGITYYLIRLPDGRVLDPYPAEGVVPIIRDGISVDFDYVPAGFESGCDLASEAVSITCFRETPPEPCSTNEGTVFLTECGEEGTFYFIRFDDGRVIDPYLAEGIEFEIIDGQRVAFDYLLADFATPCSIAEAAVTLTCIKAVDLPGTPTENCICDVCGVNNPLDLAWVEFALRGSAARGMNVFYNKTNESVVFGEMPIGPDAGISFYDCSGTVICQTGGFGGSPGFCNFDFDDLISLGSFEKPGDSPLCGSDGNQYISYCAAECQGVSIVSEGTCPSDPPVGGNQIFTDYPWLSNLVDQANCEGATIKEYNLGSFSYLLVQTPTATRLYYEDGTFYCQSAANYDCVSLYGLNETQLMSEFICGTEGDDTRGFEEFPWLDAVLNANCCGGNEAILYTRGIFNYIYISETLDCNNQYGQLYFETGQLYCTDAANYDCRAAYGLSGGRVILNCTDGSFMAEASSKSSKLLNVSNTPIFKAFPNPVSQLLTVEIPNSEQDGALKLYDLLGKTLDYRVLEKGTTNTQQIDLSNFEKGIYLLEWHSNGHSEIKKIIKQ